LLLHFRGSTLRGLASLPIRFPRTVVALFVLLAAGAFAGLPRLEQEENLLVFLPTHDADVKLFTDVSHRFGGLRVALVGCEVPAGQDVFGAEAIKRLTAATEAIKNVHGVDRVASLTSLPDVVAGPAGAEITQLIPGPPQDEAAHRALRDKVMSREAVTGSFVSRDGSAALILVFLAEGVSDREVTSALRTVAEESLKPYPVYFGGAPFAGRDIYEEAQNDVWKLSPFALAILLFVVVFSFRDPVGVVLTIVSVAFSVLMVMGGMGWWGEKFTVASSALPVILFASGSSYAVHVLGRYYLLRASKEPAIAIREALSITGPPLLIAAGTTSVGFFSFIATDVPPMRSFGIACGAGVLLCWLTSLTLVPAVVALWPRAAAPARQLRSVGEGLVWLWHRARRHRWLVIAVSLACGVLLTGPMLRVTVRMEPRAFFRKGSEPWLAEKFLEDRFGGALFVQVALAGDLDDPATLREIDRLCAFTSSLDGVAQVQSILDPLRIVNDAMGGGKRLPSTQAQAANLYFFIEGQPGIGALLGPERRDALVQVRVRGDAHKVVDALEDFVAHRLRARPGLPSPDDVADRVAWTARAVAGRSIDAAALHRALKVIAGPGEHEPEWSARRGEVARAFLDGDDAPQTAKEARGKIIDLVATGSPDARATLVGAAASPEEGGLAWDALSSALEQARRALAVKRALPLVAEAANLGAGGPLDARLAQAIEPVLDDLFLPPLATTARKELSGKVAGEPILDRGFSRSVGRNQVRSLVVSIIAVLLLLLALFRSIRLAVVCMAPSMLTMIAIFGAMGALDVHIDLATSLVAGIATGAGSDFAMHYMWYLRREDADAVSRTVGPVMVVSILLVALGFVVLALGRSPVMHLFGYLAGLSMSLSALLTCLLVPALLNKFGGSK
jgi:uncharacterized protein